MTIRVTQTQKLIAEAALAAVGANDLLKDPESIENVVRAMLVVEQGHMQAYMLRGFNWSYRSRNRNDRLGTFLERHNLEKAVEAFHGTIEGARGEAARRIRGNRARRQRELERMLAENEEKQRVRREVRRLNREMKRAVQNIEQLIA